jgi:hypothetical protein
MSDDPPDILPLPCPPPSTAGAGPYAIKELLHNKHVTARYWRKKDLAFLIGALVRLDETEDATPLQTYVANILDDSGECWPVTTHLAHLDSTDNTPPVPALDTILHLAAQAHNALVAPPLPHWPAVSSVLP